MRLRTIGLLTVLMMLSSACATSRTSGLCQRLETKAKPGDLSAAEAAAHRAWAGRRDEAKLKEAIQHYQTAVEVAPEKTSNYLKLAKALYLHADGFLRFDEDREEEMVEQFAAAVTVAEKGLQIQNPDYAFSVCSRDPFDASVKKLGKRDVPLAYWYATALGKYGLATSIVTVLDNKDKIFAIMKRVHRLYPDYNYGAADRYLGAFYTKIPFPKGDTKKSKSHFMRSIKRAPNYFATRVLVAEMLAPKLKDRALFEKSLQFVLDTPANVIPELEVEHEIEKRKAKALLEDVDTIFAE